MVNRSLLFILAVTLFCLTLPVSATGRDLNSAVGKKHLLQVAKLKQTSSIRCEGSLVLVGDNMAQVAAKCGEPTSKYQAVRKVTDDKSETIDIWYYDLGNKNLTRTLTFSGGKLESIELGEYGKPKN